MSRQFRPTLASWLRTGLTLAIFTATCLGAFSRVIARTWTSRGGSYSIEAEFVQTEGEKVVLRKPDGSIVRAAISKLSAEDQGYVAGRLAAENKTAPTGNIVPSPDSTDNSADRDSAEDDLDDRDSAGDGAPPDESSVKTPTYARLVAAANRLDKAIDALRLFKEFLKDPNITPADRKSAEEQLPLWEVRAAKDMVRVGSRWMEPGEKSDQRRQSRQLVDEAVRLIEVGQGDAAIEKCLKASKIDPSDIKADFVMGLGYALLRCDAQEANRHFAECVRRNPAHIAALNNLALTEVRLERYPQALNHWQKALELAPATREIVQNLGRAVHLSGRGDIDLVSQKRRYSDLYSAAAATTDAESFDSHKGWLYLGFYEPQVAASPDQTSPDASSKASKANLITIGSGTGFVVFPGYILTNRHVVKDEDTGGICAGFSVVPPDDSQMELSATVVGIARETESDLAVLRCEGLKAPPLPFIKEAMTRRGTEIMVLGFPGMTSDFNKKPSLKSTRGSIAGLPDDSYDAYTYDAITNPGNSGGPVCNAEGNVLGIHFAATTPLHKNYGLGIPHSRALPLLKNCIPDYRPLPPNTETKPWPEVDELASRSTVLIYAKESFSNVGISRKIEHREQNLALEDPWCMRCNGRGMIPCPNQACRNGSVSQRRNKVVGANPTNGEKYYRMIFDSVACPTCKGKGAIDCPYCDHGLDRSLK